MPSPERWVAKGKENKVSGNGPVRALTHQVLVGTGFPTKEDAREKLRDGSEGSGRRLPLLEAGKLTARGEGLRAGFLFPRKTAIGMRTAPPTRISTPRARRIFLCI